MWSQNTKPALVAKGCNAWSRAEQNKNELKGSQRIFTKIVCRIKVMETFAPAQFRYFEMSCKVYIE